MDDQQRAALLKNYDDSAARYSDLAQTAASLIDRLLKEHGISFHSITWRAKDRESLGAKMQRPGKEYSNLADITDLAGVRITTYFASDVDRTASVIESEFAIDRTNSVDRRSTMDPDRFGYLSLHYVACLSESRMALREYSRLRAVKCEIQIRSILQHAWAEIEHDLGYKAKAAVPREIQRRFARVAGLLELADAEFGAIRDFLAQYAEAVPEKVRASPGSVTIDRLSLAAYLSDSPIAKELDQLSAQVLSTHIDQGSDWILDNVAREAQWLGIATIAELEAEAAQYRRYANAFVSTLFKNSKGGSLFARHWCVSYVLPHRCRQRSRSGRGIYGRVQSRREIRPPRVRYANYGRVQEGARLITTAGYLTIVALVERSADCSLRSLLFDSLASERGR